MFRKDQDLYSGLFCIIFAGLLWTQQGNLSHMQGIFPRTCIIFMAIAGAGIILRSFLKYKKTGKTYSKLTLKDAMLQSIVPGAFLVLMASLVTKLGFYVDVCIVIIGICLIQDIFIGGFKSLKPAKLLKVFVFSVLCTGILYLCFSVLLKMTVPMGILKF